MYLSNLNESMDKNDLQKFFFLLLKLKNEKNENIL